jgi:hypothetical protein
MSKKKKRSTPAAAPAEPAKAEHPQLHEPVLGLEKAPHGITRRQQHGPLDGCFVLPEYPDFDSRLHQMAAG